MPTDPFQELLDRELRIADAGFLIEVGCPLLRELVNHATNAFVRCTRASDEDRRGGENEDLAAVVLYLQLIEQIDGIEVLFSNSCVDAAVPLLRSAFGTAISLFYILAETSTYTERSLAWTCADIHRRIQKHEQNDPSTNRGQERARIVAKYIGKPVAPYDSAVNIASLERVLARPEFERVNADFKQRREAHPKRRSPEWFRLLNGPSNRQELARKVNEEAAYVILYGDWSDQTHAASAAPYVRSAGSNERAASFRVLRSAEHLAERAVIAASLLARGTRLMIEHFRPGEPLEPWYQREIRPAFMKLSAIAKT